MKTINGTAKLNIFLMLAFLLMAVAGSSCRKLEEYPPEPFIWFNNFVLINNATTGISEKGILSIQYRDGDGNIGLEQADTVAPFHPSGEFYYNLIITYFERRNGIFVELPQNYNARIPLLLPKGQKKGIKGVIETSVDFNLASRFDTIQFKVKLIDRTLNISNEITTPPLKRIISRP